ncbi:MAG: hypothetical protein WD226_07530 [Planctomycetota bacterium]
MLTNIQALLLSLALAPLATGCVAAAAGAGAAGYLAYRESDSQLAEEYIDQDHAEVVAAVVESLDILHDVGSPVTTPKSDTAIMDASTGVRPRSFTTKIDGTDVTVRVEAFDLGRTLVKVDVQMRLTGDQQRVARLVMDEIVKRADQPGR